MTAKSLIKKALIRLSVWKCPSCGAITKLPGALCPNCLERYRAEREAPCRFCGMTAPDCVCSTRDLYFCRQLDCSLRSLIFYDPENKVFSEALSSLKYSSDRGAERFFARDLSCEILKMFAINGEIAEDWCVTFPPRRKKAARLYGFDHAKGLAKRIAKYTGMEFEDTISRRGNVEQKELDRYSRKENAAASFALKRSADVKRKKYVVVDDIVTSGATMRTCQVILLSNGAAAAFPLSIAKTPLRGAGFDAKRRFRARSSENWFS
ncbi:MAG: ComF family protein [Clostridia bacterium]|nr:ComF family protein [Clostridia bacterium]